MIEVLQQHGLSQRESNIYITWLGLWSAPSSTIARHAKENRVTVYSILKELTKKWFFSFTIRDGVKYFSPISPDVFLKKIEQKYLRSKENMPLFANILEGTVNKSKLNYYEWIEWIKNLYNEILKSKTPIYAFLSDEQIDPFLENYLNTTFITTRKKHNIHASVIVSSWNDTKNYRDIIWEDDVLTSIRIAPSHLKGLQWEIVLFWEKYVACAFYSKSEMIWFLVESENFYQSLYGLFDFVWNIIWWKK